MKKELKEDRPEMTSADNTNPLTELSVDLSAIEGDRIQKQMRPILGSRPVEFKQRQDGISKAKMP